MPKPLDNIIHMYYNNNIVRNEFLKGLKEMAKTIAVVISFPQETFKGYTIKTYPASYGRKSQMTAIIYRADNRKAVWETLPFNTPKQAIADAKKWIKVQ